MKNVINLYKPVGLSPLQVIEKFRLKHREYGKVKLGYAGRLDPMAEGVLMVLVGDENKKIRDYLKFDKEYRAEILIGLKSDSCDVLGIVEKCKVVEVDEKVLKKKLKMMKGNYEQKIPKYSSYRVRGHPMFYYALRGKSVADVKNVVEIKDVRINSIYKIGSGKLLKYVLNKIDLVDGNFRQEEIKKKWAGLLKGSENRFLVVDVSLDVSSGTYIRAISEDIGGLLLSLKRTRVGEFDSRKSEKLK